MPSGDFTDLAEHAARSAQLDPSDSTDLTQAKAKVNEIYLSVCHDGSAWDFLEREGQWTTTAGSDVYTYSSLVTAMSITSATIREVVALTNDTLGGTLLTSTDWRGLEAYSYTTQESEEGRGSPTSWAKWASRLRLYPIPDATYTIGTFCYLTPTEMSSGTDTPLIPLQHRHSVIVPGAAALLLEQEGGNEAGGAYERLMRRHTDAVRNMRMALASAKAPTFNVVAPGAFDHLDSGYEGWNW